MNEKQIEATIQSGGSTFSIGGKDMAGSPNIAVSIFPEFSETVPLSNLRLYLFAFQLKHVELMSRNRFLKVGTWKQGDRVVLDVVAMIPVSKRDEAIKLGIKYNQIAIFDLQTNVEIPTGDPCHNCREYRNCWTCRTGGLPTLEERLAEVSNV